MANRVIYGLNGVWLQKLDSAGAVTGTIVKLPPAQTFDVSPNYDDKDVRGDNRTVASRRSFTDADVSIDLVGVDIDIVAALINATVVTTDTTPSVVKTLKVNPDAQTPRWQVTGQSLGDESGDVWRRFLNVKFDPPFFDTDIDEYVISSLEGKAIPDASGDLYEIVDHETATTPS